ncbi:hypothetical protein E2C01_057722 [Portunus trituberculatus]|uniref:Uncharacterized protein n=1 Tax=Portunus trituberculatus TaxID=210409 RepID=A0A5B7GXT4_PORTR|nr:hypothetical protein [Portunus trituberculatus]
MNERGKGRGALRKKEEAAKHAWVQPGVSFAQDTQAALVTAPSGPATPDLSKSLSGLLCVFHVRMANMYNPGCFQQFLSTSLAKNGLPDLKIASPTAHTGPRAFTQPSQPTTTEAAACASGSATTAGPDVTASVASSCPSPSSSEDADESDREEDHNSIQFGFVAKRSKRRLPGSRSEFDQSICQKSLILSHTGSRDIGNTVLDFVRGNLASLDSWTVFSNEDYERVRCNPHQLIGDVRLGKLPSARE